MRWTIFQAGLIQPALVANSGLGFKPSSGVDLAYKHNPVTNTYSLLASKNDVGYYIKSSNTTPTPLAIGGAIPQSFALSWGNPTGRDRSISVIQADNGDYVVAGRTSTTTSYWGVDGDASISRYTTDGILLWNKVFGGTKNDFAYSVAQTADGGFVAAGMTESFATDQEAFITKFNGDGVALWSRTWWSGEFEWLNKIIPTSDGGFAIIGNTVGFGAGSNEALIIKYDNNGTLMWSRTFGGTSWDFVDGIVEDTDGSLIVAGSIRYFGAGGMDACIAKYSSNGDFLWMKTWGGAGDDYAESITATTDGGYVMSGSADFGAGNGDAFLAKFTDDGTLAWDSAWGGTEWDSAYSIITNDDGELVMSGVTYSFGVGSGDAFLAKFTANGALIWDKTWGGAGYDDVEFDGLASSNDGGFVVTGTTESFGGGASDSFIAKFFSDGTITGCLAPMCQDPNATITDPNASQSIPDVFRTSPTPIQSSPVITVVDLNFPTNVILAP